MEKLVARLDPEQHDVNTRHLPDGGSQPRQSAVLDEDVGQRVRHARHQVPEGEMIERSRVKSGVVAGQNGGSKEADCFQTVQGGGFGAENSLFSLSFVSGTCSVPDR